MKTATLLCLSFLVISISTYSLGAEQPDPVRDINGEILQLGSNYNIVSVIWGAGGGGVRLASTRNTTCPRDVVQNPSDLRRGLPWTFIPENSEEGVIRESTDLNIKFPGVSICRQSTVWRLDNYEGENIVTIGGVEGNPVDPETFSNWFRIEKINSEYHWYKIVFCPDVCSTCTRPICGDIGISVRDGFRRLVLAPGNPFVVYFAKANSSSSI